MPAGLERSRPIRPAPPHRGRDTASAPAQRDQQRDRGIPSRHAAASLIGEQQDREAAGELRRAIYLAPYEDEPHLLLGRLISARGRLAEAIDEFKVAIWCRETAAARRRARHRVARGRRQGAARREAERALALAPTPPRRASCSSRIGG